MDVVERSTALLIRQARRADAEALRQMFDRCSAETRYHRFHGVVRELPAAYLRQCLSDRDGLHPARVAEVVGDPDGAPYLVGLASAAPVPETHRVLELGVLVEDGWQRQGIGVALANELLARACAAGVARIRLELCRARPGLLTFLLDHLAVVESRSSGCDLSVDVDPIRPIPAQAR